MGKSFRFYWLSENDNVSAFPVTAGPMEWDRDSNLISKWIWIWMDSVGCVGCGRTDNV